ILLSLFILSYTHLVNEYIPKMGGIQPFQYIKCSDYASRRVLQRAKEFFKKGDIIEFGNYNNEPILWQVVHIDENGNPLLFSKRILTIKAFDASGDKHEHDGYYGFSRYYGSTNWEIS